MKDAKQIVGIISGDVPLGDGDADHWDVVPCGAFFVIAVLQIVRAIASLISCACDGLNYVLCLQWCRSKTNHTPTGAVKYKIVEFNAWTYKGSDLLWASLMKQLWEAVEVEFGWKAVRYHRASIELAGDNIYDEKYRTLSPQQKARNRKRVLLMFRARLFLYLFVFLIALSALLTLTIMNCANVNRTCLGKMVNVSKNAIDIVDGMDSSEEVGNEGGVLAMLSDITDNVTDIFDDLTNNASDIDDATDGSSNEEEGNEGGVLAAVIATVAAFLPLLANGTFHIEDNSIFVSLMSLTHHSRSLLV